MLKQEDYDRFVEQFNRNYLNLLIRASSAEYHCLLSAFIVLKDLYDVIMTLHEAMDLEFCVKPHAIHFRANDEMLSSFGFDRQQIDNIYGLLDYTETLHGKRFEICMEEEVPVNCSRSHVD